MNPPLASLFRADSTDLEDGDNGYSDNYTVAICIQITNLLDVGILNMKIPRHKHETIYKCHPTP